MFIRFVKWVVGIIISVSFALVAMPIVALICGWLGAMLALLIIVAAVEDALT